MRSLMYVSSAVADLDNAALNALVESASTFNAAHGITGCLAFNGLNFLQVIEGDDAALDACMVRIRADTRHEGIVVLRDTQVKTREFPDWAMAGRIVPLSRSNQPTSILADLLARADVETRKIFRSFSTLASL